MMHQCGIIANIDRPDNSNVNEQWPYVIPRDHT